MPGLLHDLRVIDLSWGIAGPMTAMLLADQGAQVTKVEPPGGDPFRFQPGYRVWNRGKRSALINLTDGEGYENFLDLVRRADILIEAFSPGTTQRLRIDWPTLSLVNSRLIYCSITGYGHGTKDADRPGYDALVAARSGLQWEQRGPDGGIFGHLRGREIPLSDIGIVSADRPGPGRDGPLYSSSPWPSLGACFLASNGTAAALYERSLSGFGQLVETSLVQGAMASAALVWQRPANPDAPGYACWQFDARAPIMSFLCSDGKWVNCPIPSPNFVLSQKDNDELMVREDTIGPRDDPDRLQSDHWELARILALYPEIKGTFLRFPSDAWVELGAKVGMPVAVVVSPGEALRNVDCLKDGSVAEVLDPDLGPLRQAGFSYFLDSYPGVIQGPAPRVGQHTEEVLAEITLARGHRPPEAPSSCAPPPNPTVGRPGPLGGITVLDLGLAVAGPFAGQVLAGLGANVIKVHSLRERGMATRQMMVAATRGKRSIALDAKTADGKRILQQLIAGADVLLHNMRSSAAGRLGISYQDARTINPRLVYCQLRAFELGPRTELVGNDPIAAAAAGVMWEDGACASGGRPIWALTPFGDTGAGYLSTLAIVLGLIARERTGVGQEVSTSLMNACLLNTSYVTLDEDGRELRQPALDRDQRGIGPLCMLYPTATEWICLNAVLEEHWTRLCVAIDRVDLLADTRFETHEARSRNRDELAALLEAVFKTTDADRWMDRFDQAGVPCEKSVARTVDEIFDDAERQELGWVSSYDDAVLGKFDQAGSLVALSRTPGPNNLTTPQVGEHTRDILRELGYSDSEIDAFVAKGAVATGDG